VDCEDLFLIATDGGAVFSVNQGEDMGSNYKTGPYRNSSLAKVFDRANTLLETDISDFAYYQATNEPAAFVAAPVLKEGVVLGVVAFQLNNQKVYDLVQDYTGLGQSGETVIASRMGDQVVFLTPTRSDPYAAFRRRLPIGSELALPMQKAVQATKGNGTATDYRGVQVLAVWRYLPSSRWGMVVKMDTDEAFRPIRNLKNRCLAIGVLVLVIVTLAALVVAGTLSRPITSLKLSAKSLASGDLTARAEVSTNDEIGELAAEFNTMAQQIDLSTRELRQLTESLEQHAAKSKRTAQRFRNTVEAAPTAMVMIDRQGTIVLTNDSADQMFGYARGELLGHLVEKLVPEQFRPGHPQLRLDFFARSEARKADVGRDLHAVRKDGSELPVEIGLSPVETDEGLFVLSVIVDITERKRLREAQQKLNEELERRVESRTQALVESEEKYRDLFENASDLIQSVAPDGSFDYVNPAWKMSLGYSDDEVTNLSMFDIIHPDSQEHCQEMFRRIMAGEHLDRIEAKFVTKDGRAIVVEGSSSCKFDSGAPVTTRGIFRDVTKRKQAEEKLKEQDEKLKNANEELNVANEALEQSNLELQQFACIASHDLQTPLRSIAGFAQFLQKEYHGQLDDQADDYIERMVGGVKRMQTMINDLLAYSRVESRSVPFLPVDLSRVCDATVVLLRASIEDVDGKVTRDELPTIAGDRSQLMQLLQNLIGNGIKYHGENTPRMHVSAGMTSDVWTIAVRDNGIGIDARYHEQIFEIFRRLHTEEEYQGTGIGLAICRRIVHRHGGQIWLESEPGKGSTFYFSIPARAPEDT
jgi:PAS domain S-box-containing protein